MMHIVVSILVMAACFCFYILKKPGTRFEKITWLFYTAIFLAALVTFGEKVIYRIGHPEIWDFTCFYLYGKVAVSGYNYYLPESLHAVFNSLHLPFSDYQGFVNEVVDVGFLYPPPTILYFAPLGLMPYGTALTVWTLFNVGVVLGCIYLLYDQVFKSDRIKGVMLAAIFLLLLSSSRSTVFYSQTNFILLLYLLLMHKYSEKRIAGVFLALAIFTKPYMAIFILYFIARKKWPALLYFIIASAILSGITAILFGIDPFISYITDNPAHRIIPLAFYETINQSLHAVLLRMNLITLEKPVVYTVIVSGILVMTGLYLVFLVWKKLFDFILPVLASVGLLIYPGTLSPYGVILIFVIAQLLNKGHSINIPSWWGILLIGIFYYLDAVSLFSAICLLIIFLVLRSLKPGMPIFKPGWPYRV
ncbi:MAG: DUF2029 domain-containing protein [Chitinophagales bacterium]|nr:DUF2029 domain-containing protein [Chitinophagales bacterium]